jgi:hypothetical protein
MPENEDAIRVGLMSPPPPPPPVRDPGRRYAPAHPVQRAPLLARVCVIVALAALAWLVMLFVVTGVAMLVSMAGGDFVEWLIRVPAIVLVAAWVLGWIVVRISDMRARKR